MNGPSSADASTTSRKRKPGGEGIEDDLLCTLCHNLVKDAVQLTCCGSGFCRCCAQQALRDNGQQCPSCAVPATAESISTDARTERRSASAVRPCPHAGCVFRGNRADSAVHEENDHVDYRQIAAELKARLAACQSQHDSAVRAVEMKCKEEIQTAALKCADQLRECEAKHQETFTALVRQHAESLADTKLAHKLELYDYQQQQSEDRSLREDSVRHAEEMAALRAKHSAELRAVEAKERESVVSLKSKLRTLAYEHIRSSTDVRTSLLKEVAGVPVLRMCEYSVKETRRLYELKYARGDHSYAVDVILASGKVSVFFRRAGNAPPDKSAAITFLHPSDTAKNATLKPKSWPTGETSWGFPNVYTKETFSQFIRNGQFAVAVL